MKILLLNPHLYDAPILTTLQKLGVAVIVCSDLKECQLVHKFHTSSVTLFVGHDDDGVKMNEYLKTNPRYARTPVILTTSRWSDQQCIDHQATPYAANAYLRMPVDDKDFIHVIDEILGTELSHGKGFNISDDLSAIAPMAPTKKSVPAPVATPMLAPTPVAEELPEPTGLAILTSGSDAPSSDAPFTQTKDGVTLLGITLGEPEGLQISTPNDIQVEDAASVYGVPTPGLEGGEEIFASSGISLDAPSFDLDESPSEENDSDGLSSGTMEIRPQAAETEEGLSNLASPIEAISADVPDFIHDLSIRAADLESAIPADEQATRVAVMPGFAAMPPSDDEAPTRVQMSPPPASSYSSHTNSEELDADALATMPYLGRKSDMGSSRSNYMNPLSYTEPMDDAVVPGGAATAPDVETLKKYLYLREQDVTALSAQLRQAREQIGGLENQLKHERAISSEFAHLAQEQDRRIDGFDKEKFVALEAAQKEVDDLKFEMKRRSEKIRVMELQVKDATDATERLKERVRGDIRKIRTREKELENRLEIMKKDSEALLGSREQKIIELKRKLDLIEFNTDLLQDQLEKERRTNTALREKLAKAAQIVRVAGGLLSPEEEALLTNRETTDATRTSAA